MPQTSSENPTKPEKRIKSQLKRSERRRGKKAEEEVDLLAAFDVIDGVFSRLIDPTSNFLTD